MKLDEFNPENSEIRFFKNGVDLGIAYSGLEDIPKGVYFPAISLFGMVSLINICFSSI